MLGAAPTPDPWSGLEVERTRLIVGLGNPGPEYRQTRHNVGFRCVEELASRCHTEWVDDVRHTRSLVARAVAGDVRLVLAEPQTFMNRSGEAVRALVEQSRIALHHVLVVYDDMDLPFGVLRLRERGSAGTHNGMRSIVAALGTEQVPRLRVGIGQAAPGQATDHVLSRFAPEQQDQVEDLVKRAADAAQAWAIENAAAAMNRYNKL
ncbi:MAG: aminoacyl-tRNA hydrolase [Chloroflexota bacterium]|nr:aminoacyl-tRNA hydrolase [Chloroflexota bacterium]